MLFTSMSPTGYEFREGGLPEGYDCTGLASDGVDPSTLYAIVNNVVYKTTDGGLNWTSLGWPTSGYVRAIYGNASVAGEIWAAYYMGSDNSANGMYKSTNYGANWTQKHSFYTLPGGYHDTKNVVAHGNRVFAGYGAASAYGGGCWVSQDGGESWIMEVYHSYVDQLVTMARKAPLKGATWTSVGHSLHGWSGPAVTADGGDNWTDRDEDIGANSLTGIEYSPDGSYMFKCYAGDVWRSTNDGQSWTKVVDSAYAWFTCTDQDNLHCYAAGEGGRIWYSTDGGINWNSFQTDRALNIKAMHIAFGLRARVAYKLVVS